MNYKFFKYKIKCDDGVMLYLAVSESRRLVRADAEGAGDLIPESIL